MKFIQIKFVLTFPLLIFFFNSFLNFFFNCTFVSLCLKLHMSFTGFILCLITGCSLLPSAVCLLSQILLNSNFPHFSTKLTNFDSISWKQTNPAKADKTWVITNICQRNSCYLWKNNVITGFTCLYLYKMKITKYVWIWWQICGKMHKFYSFKKRGFGETYFYL